MLCNAENLKKTQKHESKVAFSFARTPIFLPKRPKKGLFFLSVLIRRNEFFSLKHCGAVNCAYLLTCVFHVSWRPKPGHVQLMQNRPLQGALFMAEASD